MLLNLSGGSPDYPGEQYISPGFVAQTLPEGLEACRAALLGQSADRAGLNWRAQELLTCVHASGYGEYLTALDSRLTYWPFDTSLFDALAQGPTASQTVGIAQELEIVGDYSVPSPDDRIYFEWQVQIASGTATITYQAADGRWTTVAESYVMTSGLSSPVPLPESALSVVFDGTVNTQWLISRLYRPARSLPQVAMEAAGEADNFNASVFAGSNIEPMQTFLNLWENHDQLPYRLAGLTLALIYQLDAL